MTELQDLHRQTVQADADADAARTQFRAALQHAHFQDGRSYRDLAGELGLHWTTVSAHCNPGAPRVRKPPPTLEELVAASTQSVPNSYQPARPEPLPAVFESGWERELRLSRERDAGRPE